MTARKPHQTLADYMVIALSPALIMALVGSLCFFLIDVFYRGQMAGSVRWVMFWFVVAIVLVSRIAIEKSSEHAALYGLALGAAVWLFLVRTHPSYLLGLLLLAVVWFCAHKLVWDCTLIDDDLDASGQGLLQRAPPAAAAPATRAKPKRKPAASSSPGRWVVYFSVAALPLFGLGQALLPADDPGPRRAGFALLVLYLAAALGLLVTTSFLGLRRYLRQRYLQMPGLIALAWVKLGGGVALLILIGALFLPRPGAGVAWTALRREVDDRLRQASQYASRGNPRGEGQGRAGNNNGTSQNDNGAAAGSGLKEGRGKTPDQNEGSQPSAGPGQPAPAPTAQAAGLYVFFRACVLIAAAIVAGWWLIRCRHLLGEIFRMAWAALRDFFRRLLDLVPARKPVRPSAPGFSPAPRRPLSEFKNPFYAGNEYARPPAEIILYTYDALQAWAGEHGIEPRPGQTAREFCQAMAGPLPEAAPALRQLSCLYAHAAYAQHLPADCDLEPLKELWRRITWYGGAGNPPENAALPPGAAPG
jgi:hypothetical protein